MKAELLEYGPDIIAEEISIIFNEIAKTGEYPKELVQGILNPIQKPVKTKGPVGNLRLILLSMIIKILAICLDKRLIERFDKEIPPSQAAYRQGRSTTEHVFATKILAEKAITSQNYTIYLLMLDMSKAFDTVDRTMLLEDLSPVIEKDELFMIKLLLGVELSVRCGKSESELFNTDIAVPQGDGLSANEFTLYLAKTLYHEKHNDHTYPSCTYKTTKMTPPFILEHSYHQHVENHVRIDQEYADDLYRRSLLIHIPSNISYKNTLPSKFPMRNLQINKSKTEEYTIKRKGANSSPALLVSVCEGRPFVDLSHTRQEALGTSLEKVMKAGKIANCSVAYLILTTILEGEKDLRSVPLTE